MDKITEKNKIIYEIINDNHFLLDTTIQQIYGLYVFDFVEDLIQIILNIRDDVDADVDIDNYNFDELLSNIESGINNLDSYIKTIQEGDEYRWFLIRDIIEGLTISRERIIQSSFYSLNTLFNKKLKF
jgi:hypothetical protein